MEEGRSRDTGRDQQRSHAGREQAPRQRRGLRPFNPTDRRQAIGPGGAQRRNHPRPGGAHQARQTRAHGQHLRRSRKQHHQGEAQESTRAAGRSTSSRPAARAGSSRPAALKDRSPVTKEKGEGGERTHPPRRATSSGRRATGWLTVARQLGGYTGRHATEPAAVPRRPGLRLGRPMGPRQGRAQLPTEPPQHDSGSRQLEPHQGDHTVAQHHRRAAPGRTGRQHHQGQHITKQIHRSPRARVERARARANRRVQTVKAKTRSAASHSRQRPQRRRPRRSAGGWRR